MRRPWFRLAVGGLVALTALTGCEPSKNGGDAATGREAPELVARDLDGKEVRLSSLRGKVVMLDFWATWCHYCREMIPREKATVQRLKDKPFVLVGLSVDDDRKTVAEFVEQEKMPWTQWWVGPRGAAEDWGVEGFPTTFVLDAKGVIRYEDEGFDDKSYDKMEKVIDGLLQEMDQKKE